MMRDNKNETLDDLFNSKGNFIRMDQSDRVEAARMYQEKLEHTISFYLLLEAVSGEQIFEKVKCCLESEEDNLLQLFEVQIDEKTP